MHTLWFIWASDSCCWPSRMASGGDGHRHARSQTMPIIRGKNALTNPKLLQLMEPGNKYSEVTVRLRWCICYSYVLLFLDGIQDGDTLSPTDVEANMSTEVALTVLDVLELFVQHQKVCDHFILYNPKVKLIPQSITLYSITKYYTAATH